MNDLLVALISYSVLVTCAALYLYRASRRAEARFEEQRGQAAKLWVKNRVLQDQMDRLDRGSARKRVVDTKGEISP